MAKKKVEDEFKIKKKPIFEHLKDLTERKISLDMSDPGETGSYEPFMINRFVSMCEMYLPLVNEVNQISDLPKDVHHRYYLTTLPKRKQFFKYIKKSKDVDKVSKERISEYFECSMRVADIYAEILETEQIKEIKQKFDCGRG